jgi:DNA replication and repair protein RecF
MRLTRVTAQNLRILAAVALEPGPGLNLVVGANASGKTSLLEAIYLLGRGRPLRPRHGDRLIRDGCDQLQVSGEIELDSGRRRPIGVARGAAGLQMRLDGQQVRSALELATALPLQYIHPDIHQLVQSGPGLRRQFLDRGVFHVEHDFLETWRRYQRTLRQRNAALKEGAHACAWDGELALQGERLDSMRVRYLEGLAPFLRANAAALLGRDDVAVGYRRGWSASQPLATVLADAAAVDRRQGFTGRGAHRCDFALTLGGVAIQERISRGQQKLLLCALQLAQAQLQRQRTGSAGLLLIDDLPAELDTDHRARLLDTVVALNTQVLVTATDLALLDHAGAQGAPPRVFHVEHGVVTPIKMV